MQTVLMSSTKMQFNKSKIKLLYYLSLQSEPVTSREISEGTGLSYFYVFNRTKEFSREYKGKYNQLIHRGVRAEKDGPVYVYTIIQQGRDRLEWIKSHYPARYKEAMAEMMEYQKNLLKGTNDNPKTQ